MGRANGGDHVQDIVTGFIPKRLRGYDDGHASRTRLLSSMYTRVLSEMAVGRFKWEGVPPEIDSRFIEMELFNSGHVVWFQDGERPHDGWGTDKFLCTRAAPLGWPNLYDNPTEWRVYGQATGYPDRTLKREDCVPIWSNAFRQTDQDIIQVFAWELANIRRTIEINADSARMPKILFTNEDQKLGVINMTRQINEGVPVITVDKNQFNTEMIQVLDLAVHPQHLTDMDILFIRTFSHCMSMLGIDNANQDKKERLVASEVDANAQQVYSIKRSNLNEREAAVERIKRKWPELSELKVSYHVDSMQDSAAEGNDSNPGVDLTAPTVTNVGN